MKKNKMLLRLFGIIIAFLSLGCKQNGDYNKAMSDPLLYCKTVKNLNNVVLENIFSPPVASRNYVYANIAAYEAMVPGDHRFASLRGIIRHMPPMPQPDSTKTYCFPFASLIAFCKVGDNVTFSQEVMANYIAYLIHFADSVGMPSDVKKNSLAYADAIAQAIITWSKGDNYLKTRGAPQYTVKPDSISRWVPTPPAYEDALEPHWGEIRLMLLDSLNEIKAPPPIPFNITDKKSKYYQEILAIKHAGDSLTDEQKHIADFWDDIPVHLNVTGHLMYMTKKFSPPGHWMNICGIASEKTNADFATTVYAYTTTAIALFDAFITCWHEKYTYNTVRPETIINRFMDENWRPHIETPPFPEYTCGHSTISAAAAEALTHVYGDHIAYTDTSENEFGIKSRSFASFRQAAKENIEARFYGGIHLPSTCEISNKIGTQIGAMVANKLAMAKKY